MWAAEADAAIDRLLMEDRRDRSKQMTARVDSGLTGGGKQAWRGGYDILSDTPVGSP
jgi:hypothetical protein